MSEITQEKEIPPAIRMDHAQGGIWLRKSFTGKYSRAGIADAFLLNAMNEVIGEYFSPDPALWWEQTGESWAVHFYEQLVTGLSETPREGVSRPQEILKEDFVEYLNGYFSFTGIGQFRITEGNKFYVIDIKNPFICNGNLANPEFFIRLLSGFFNRLFSLLSEKTLICEPLSDPSDKDKLRFAISTDNIIAEIREMKNQRKSEKEILEQFKNQHIL